MGKSKDIIERIKDKDNIAAHTYVKKLVLESNEKDEYLEIVPALVNLLKDENSYLRTRAFILICAQAKWLDKNQIGKLLDEMLPLIYDSKPTVVRQCLSAIQNIVINIPTTSNKIEKAIKKIDLSIYKDSMSPLIQKDIDELLKLIKKNDL